MPDFTAVIYVICLGLVALVISCLVCFAVGYVVGQLEIRDE